MKGESVDTREKRLLKHLGQVQRMMAYNHSLDNLSAFVLHDLCSESCFNINKAAYFVNNPDFNCLRGIAGYSRPESYQADHLTWDHPKGFTSHMNGSSFNQQVRNIEDVNFQLGTASENEKIEMIADTLKIQDPMHHVWNAKHDNHGLFVYEKPQGDLSHLDDHLLDYLHSFSFCPIY